jgi:hypothetical protein
MQCPYLTGKKVLTCTVNGYVPSISDLAQYCRSEKYEECPLLRNSVNANKSPPDPAVGTRRPWEQVV